MIIKNPDRKIILQETKKERDNTDLMYMLIGLAVTLGILALLNFAGGFCDIPSSF